MWAPLQDRQKQAKPEAAVPLEANSANESIPNDAALHANTPKNAPSPSVLNDAPNYVLEEYRRQYLHLTYIQMAGALGIFTGVSALALIAWAIIYKPNLRAKVTAMGVDPQEWAEPIDAPFWRVIIWAMAAYVGFAAVGLLIWGIVALLQTHA